MNCRKCGAELQPDAMTCPMCGESVKPSARIPILAALVIMMLVLGFVLLISQGGK